MANFLRCLESEKGREEMWPGSTSTFGCPLWLGGIEGSQGTPEEAASSSSWEGVLTASCEEEREDRQPCWDSAPVLCHCLLLIPRIWSLCPWAVHLHEPKLLCFGRGECRKWKGDPRRPLATPLQCSMWIVLLKMGSFILQVKQGKKLSDFKLALSENLFQNLGHLGLLEQDFLSSEKGLPEGVWSEKKKKRCGGETRWKKTISYCCRVL